MKMTEKEIEKAEKGHQVFDSILALLGWSHKLLESIIY